MTKPSNSLSLRGPIGSNNSKISNFEEGEKILLKYSIFCFLVSKDYNNCLFFLFFRSSLLDKPRLISSELFAKRKAADNKILWPMWRWSNVPPKTILFNEFMAFYLFCPSIYLFIMLVYYWKFYKKLVIYSLVEFEASTLKLGY